MPRTWPQPRPVVVNHTLGSGRPGPGRVGLLLEWRQVADGRGVPQWEGLVVWARGGGELPWSVEMSWVAATYLRPIGD